MAVIPAQSAIADLINLAEQGEIDPWDVPVIDVIDRFLTELGLIDETISVKQEADLPQSGQAFLWASMLVLFKADTLELLQQENYGGEHSESIEEELLTEVENRRSLPLHLEHHLHRRTAPSPMGKRRVTLTELIEQLEHIAAEIEASSSSSRPQKSSRSRREAIRAITQLAHNENLSELAIQLERFLYLDLPQLAPNQDYIDWEQLLQWWINKHNADEQTLMNNINHSSCSERAGVFWALLLLSAQSKVELSQQEFYQDLTIRPLNF